MAEKIVALALFAGALIVLGILAFVRAQNGRTDKAFFGDETNSEIEVSPARFYRNLLKNAFAFAVIFAIAIAASWFLAARP